MKCGFKTNKTLTAVAETDHTVTTSEGRVIHKKISIQTLEISHIKKARGPKEGHQQMQQMWKI